MRSPAFSPCFVASGASAVVGPRTFALGAVALSLVIAFPSLLVAQTVAQNAAIDEPPAALPATLPATPAAVSEVVVMRPFVLDEGFNSDWSAERPLVRSGWILVLRADPALLRPRQTQEPILFVGDQVAERLNSGAGSGYTVVLVPAELAAPAAGAAPDAPPTVAPILVDRPAFFGTPGTAEAVTREMATNELAQAIAAGYSAPTPAARTEALTRGGELLQSTDRAALLVAAASLVRTWSPEETARAQELEGLPITDVAAPVVQPTR